MKAAIYTRVSTADQNSELQLRELQEYASRQGWEVIKTYQDVISGAKASRPGLNRLMDDAQARKFDCLLVWKLDRFGRSLVDCLNNIEALGRWRIRFIATTQNLLRASAQISVQAIEDEGNRKDVRSSLRGWI